MLTKKGEELLVFALVQREQVLADIRQTVQHLQNFGSFDNLTHNTASLSQISLHGITKIYFCGYAEWLCITSTG